MKKRVVTDEMTARACRIALGQEDPGPDVPQFQIMAAHRDYYSHKDWYREVYRKGRWRRISNEQLPKGVPAAVHGTVALGEIISEYGAGGPVVAMWLVAGHNPRVPIKWLTFRRYRGKLVINLPEGAGKVRLPDPSKKPKKTPS